MRRLGASADWEYADSEGQKSGYFTMDAKMSRAVVEVFVRLSEEGLIYRGKRLVNWDPVLGTAVSDLEVDHRGGGRQDLGDPLSRSRTAAARSWWRPPARKPCSATSRWRCTRGCALCDLVGKTLRCRWRPREPGHRRQYVDREFGTGRQDHAGHDFNDYGVGKRHEPGAGHHLHAGCEDQRERAGDSIRGLDRFEARKRVVADLEAQASGRRETVQAARAARDRTSEVVEPMLTDQWFVKMEGIGEGRRSRW